MGWFRNFFTFPYWFCWTVACKGRRDGRKNYPKEEHCRDVIYYKNSTPDSPVLENETKRLSFYEAEIIDDAEERSERLYLKWQKVKHRLEAKAKEIKHLLDDLLNEYEKSYRRHRDKGFEQPHQIFPKWLYAPFMIILGIFEMPFNAEAFKILRVSQNELYIYAAGPSIGIPLLAHFLGTKIRQWPKEGAHWKIILIAIFCGVSLLIGLVAIAFLRAKYIAYTMKTDINPMDAVALLGINLIFLAVGIIAAYFAHDPDRQLERICKEKAILRKKLYKTWDKWNYVAGKYDTYRGITMANINIIREDTIAKVDEYRQYNTMFRSDNLVPSWFGKLIDEGFFKTRNFGDELDRTPEALDNTIEEIERKIKEEG